MKKILNLFICLILLILTASCDDIIIENQEDERYDIYLLAQEAGYKGTYEEWLESIKGEKGEDGHSPVITIENGYWYIDGVNTNVIAQTNTNKWEGRSAVFIGDSITYGVGTNKIYYEYIKETLLLGNVKAFGVSGSCISSKSDYGLDNSPLSNRINSIPSADLIVVFMGTNDYGHETPLGSIDDTDDVSFYGALNFVAKTLITNNPTSTIIFVTPLHRYGFGTSKILNQSFTYDYLPNGVGHSLKDYKDAIVNVCERWSIPVVDLYGNSGINPAIPSIKNNYFTDGIHPNSNGHERISEIICNELEDLYVGVKNEAIDNESDLMQYGNKFVSSFTEHNRASSVLNIYLEKGQTVTLIDNVNYQWALAGANSPTSTIKSHGYYPASAWSSIKSYVVEQSGYYGILLMKVDGTEFDFETSPESNNIYNYIIIE